MQKDLLLSNIFNTSPFFFFPFSVRGGVLECGYLQSTSIAPRAYFSLGIRFFLLCDVFPICRTGLTLLFLISRLTSTHTKFTRVGAVT